MENFRIDSFQEQPDGGQFATMGNAVINQQTMARSCSRLLVDEYGLSLKEAAAIFDTDENGILLMREGVLPDDHAFLAVEQIAAIQSVLLDAYSPEGMKAWFHAEDRNLLDSPIAYLRTKGNEGLGDVLQAAVARVAH